MSDTCYMIGYIDVKTLKVCGAQLASESARTITTMNHNFPFDVLEVSGDSYAEARSRMIEVLRDYTKYPRYKKLIELLSEEDRTDHEDDGKYGLGCT